MEELSKYLKRVYGSELVPNGGPGIEIEALRSSASADSWRTQRRERLLQQISEEGTYFFSKAYSILIPPEKIKYT